MYLGFDTSIHVRVCLQVVPRESSLAGIPRTLHRGVCICRLCPESPRWLVSRERYTEAEAILQKVADINGRELPPKLDLTPDPVSSQFMNVKQQILLKALVAAAAAAILPSRCCSHFVDGEHREGHFRRPLPLPSTTQGNSRHLFGLVCQKNPILRTPTAAK